MNALAHYCFWVGFGLYGDFVGFVGAEQRSSAQGCLGFLWRLWRSACLRSLGFWRHVMSISFEMIWKCICDDGILG